MKRLRKPTPMEAARGMIQQQVDPESEITPTAIKQYRRRIAFAKEYLRNGQDGVEAYTRVYYDRAISRAGAASAARLLLEHDDVKEVLAQAEVHALRATQDVARKYGLTRARVLEELAVVGFASIGDYMTEDEDGNPVLTFSHLTPQQKLALRRVAIEKGPKGDVRKVTFEMHDKLTALTKIADMQGWDEPELGTPEAAVDITRQAAIRARLHQMLKDMAKPEPLTLEAQAEPVDWEPGKSRER